MKGIVFNLFEEVVTTEIEEEAWDAVLEGAKVKGAYTSLGNYPDEEFVRLVETLAQQLNRDQHELLSWFGRHAIGFLARRYPEFFTPHTRLRPFLLTLNDVIHAEVRKLYPDVDVPVFEFDGRTSDPDSPLAMRYRSRRRLCFLAEGFIRGAADYYREAVHIQQQSCMLEGDDECTLLCTFESGT